VTGDHLFRVERGDPDAVELAALAAVLSALAAGVPSGPARHRPVPARWHRLERASGFTGPRTWRRATPAVVHILREGN